MRGRTGAGPLSDCRLMTWLGWSGESLLVRSRAPRPLRNPAGTVIVDVSKLALAGRLSAGSTWATCRWPLPVVSASAADSSVSLEVGTG